MNLIQSVIWHFSKHRIISETTMLLIGLSILLMASISLYHIFIKQEEYGRRMVWVGLMVRVLMVVAFTVEFYHYTSIYPLRTVQIFSKERAMDQLIYLLFYGYIVAVGLYAVLTIKTAKYRGFFHAFDIAMVSIPLLHIFTLVIQEAYRVMTGQTENLVEVLFAMGIIGVVFVSLYFFFRLYWQRNILNYILFFTTATFPLIVLKVLGVYDLKHHPLFILQLFIILLALYEGVRKITLHLIAEKQLHFARYPYLLAIFPVVLIFMANPIYNIWHVGTSSGVYAIQETYHQGTPVTTLAAAQELARIATGNYTDRIILDYRIQENFHNGYWLHVGNYRVEVSSIGGYISQLQRKGDYEPAQNSYLSSQEEVERITIEWLTKIGFSYDPREIAIDIQEDENVYNLDFKKKFSDGSTQNEGEIWRTARLSWYKDGTLKYFTGGGYFPTVASAAKKMLAGLDLETLVTNWYSLLGEEAKPYIIQGGFTNRFTGLPNRLELEMKNKDRIIINKDGNITSFIRSSSREDNPFKGSREERRQIAEKYLDEIIPKEERSYFTIPNKGLYQESTGNYEFNYQKGEIGTRYVSINLDEAGKLSSVNTGTRVARDKYQNVDDFPISRQQAIAAVRKFYRPFEIYNQRVMLAAVFNEEEIPGYNWMIVIFPFGKAEHHVYFVDVYTGEIDEIYGYKEGVGIE